MFFFLRKKEKKRKMSGIYLIVWDEVHKNHSRLLKSTKGGYPHVTIAYTGAQLSTKTLKEVAIQVFDQWVLNPVILQRAEVSSWEDKKTGHMRHDVLLICSDETQAEIEESRTLFLRNAFANHTHFTMRKPHVTHGSFEERGEAERVAQELNTQFLPHGVVITGVTID